MGSPSPPFFVPALPFPSSFIKRLVCSDRAGSSVTFFDSGAAPTTAGPAVHLLFCPGKARTFRAPVRPGLSGPRSGADAAGALSSRLYLVLLTHVRLRKFSENRDLQLRDNRSICFFWKQLRVRTFLEGIFGVSASRLSTRDLVPRKVLRSGTCPLKRIRPSDT